jgi:type VI secretion system protein ImpA
VANRVAPLGGLNGLDGADGTLIGPIHNIPLTGESASEGPFARWHYRQAADIEGITDPEKRQKRIDGGAITMDRINKAEAETPAEFAKNLLDDLAGCIKEFDALSALLDEMCGRDAAGRPAAPPTSTIRNALKECHSVVEAICKSKFVGVEDSGGDSGGAGPGKFSGGDSGRAWAGGKIRSRNEAFQALLQVAQFFKETEPHSPISYALERAVRWGKMPLPELLSELISEEGSRSSVFKLVGIPPPKESSEG